MSEWEEYQLDEVIEKFIDYRGKTPRKVACGIPLITAKVIKDGAILPPDEFIEPNEYSTWMTRGLPNINDVLLTTEAPLGEVALIQDENIALAQRIILLRGKQNIIDNGFLFYSLRTDLMQHRLSARASGSTVQGIKSAELKKVLIPLPDIDTQKQIVLTLSCLDRKISNLRQQNKTLEAIAQTLFKHWFVDFEFPNEDGKPYRSSGGEMERSELGEIPAGWRVGKLSELTTVNPRESIKKGGFIKYVDMKSLSTSSMEITDFITREFTSGSKFRNFDTLLARITPCLENGKTAFVNILDKNEVAYGSTEFIVIRANANCCPEYVYCLSRSLHFRDYAIKNMTGSSGRQRVPNDRVEDYRLVIPTLSIVQSFHSICNSLFLKIKSNQQQIQTLTKTRDRLLPKLMSGKLRITEGSS